MALQRGAEFISFRLPLSPALTCAKKAVFLTMHHVVAMIRTCVRLCASVHTPYYPSLTLDCTPLRTHRHTFVAHPNSLAAACNKSTVHPEKQPARLSLASPSSLSFYHTQPHRSRLSGGEARARMVFLSSQHLTYPPKRCHFLCLLIT